MAKHGNRFYLELSRKIFTDEYKSLSKEAKWLYVVLKELEHRFTDGKNEKTDGSFFQSNEDLAAFSGLGKTKCKEAKKELIESGLVETWQGHLETDGKQSKRHITYYRVK